MRQKPYRPNNEITQTYNDGSVTVYSVEDGSQPGHKPVEKLSQKAVLRYAERRLGIQRFYSGKQNQVQIERVIRCPRTGLINTQDVAITEDGNQYRIHLVQLADGVYPPSVDVTLVRTTQKYEVKQ